MEISKLNGFEIRDDKAREQAKTAIDAFNEAAPVINNMSENVNALIRANVIYDERITAADEKATAAAEKAREADDAAYNYNYRMNERVTALEDAVNNGATGGGSSGEGGSVTSLSWDAITGKPETFPPDAHTHTAADVGAKPADYAPTWDEVTGKPETFPPSEHVHDAPTWESVTGKPETFPPSDHVHDAPTWESVTGKPATLTGVIVEEWTFTLEDGSTVTKKVLTNA